VRGKKFKEIRKANGLTQQAMAELLFYSLKTIQTWEKHDKQLPTGIEAQFRRMGIDVPDPSWIDDINEQ
jgi:DNA-binding transcriptional regulator YiaG